MICIAENGQPDPILPSSGEQKIIRAEERFPTQRTVVVIPLAPDGRPDKSARFQGICKNVSANGVCLELATKGDLPSQNLIVSHQGKDGGLQFASVDVRHANRTSSGQLEIGGRIGGNIQEILNMQEILPIYKPDRMEFGYEVHKSLLQRLVETGMLQPVVIDRIQVCPTCDGLPTFRQACRKCGSALTISERFIHHFACAYVGAITDFETNGGLVCPKCRARHLVIGADFEYLTGRFQCLNCKWSDSELEQIGHCLRCSYRFPGHQAAVREVLGYHTNRLDPLALLPAD